MPKDDVTLFTWGYDGWGNWTDKLVQTVDAVEASRGWGSPMFVDIRASRKVRAEGFREKAFEKRFGPDRYRWIQGLGNKAIITHEKYGSFVNPAAAVDLLDLAVEMSAKKRRLIYFCSCISPTNGCHRHWVAPELFKVAKERQQLVTIVEWPGYESDVKTVPTTTSEPAVYRALVADKRASLPLGGEPPSSLWLALPWYTPVDVKCGQEEATMYSGPAQYRAGGWQLPVLGGAVPSAKTPKLLASSRKELFLLPRSWPKDQPTQRPTEWKVQSQTWSLVT